VIQITGGGAYAPLTYFFVALAVAAFVVEAWAFIDAITRPAQGFPAVGKLSKPIWLIILGVAFVVGLYAAVYGGAVGFLSVLAFVAAAIYLADMRPKLKEFRRGRSSSSGPYGPW
jgi:hypothetical protein